MKCVPSKKRKASEIESDNRHRLKKVASSIEVNEMACSSNWIVEMLREDINPSKEMVRWEKTSIYQVPEWIKKLTKEEAFQPWLVSLGPFHHGKPDLLPMEEHKRRAMLHLVKRSGKPPEDFVSTIEKVVDELQDAYQGLDKDKWYRSDGKDNFVKMMVIDGCFLLEVMRLQYTADRCENHGAYAYNDPVFSSHGIHCLSGAIRADMVVLENQLPLLVLKSLVAVQDGEPPSDSKINNLVYSFLDLEGCDLKGMDKLALHPLDLFHSGFCSDQQGEECYEQDVGGDDQQGEECYEQGVGIATAVELREAGIRFKASKTKTKLNIDFNNGVLTLPKVNIYESSEKEFLNLMVFEQLHCCDAGSDVTNYLVFMDQIIDSERDVALLRDKEIIGNLNDKEVVDLFSITNKGGTPKLTAKVLKVKKKLWVHYKRSRNRWGAFFRHTYMRNPCLFISLVAAVIVVAATLLQTVYSVMDSYTSKS